MASVTFQGTPQNLVGELPAVGAAAPEFILVDNGLGHKTLAEYEGKVLVLVTVPSLDTPVCDMEVRRFNQEAAALSDKVAIVCVSRDLPFAQARWCGAAGVKAVETLSDYVDGHFGVAYGVYLEDWNLLARSVFIVKDGKVAYVQLVNEIADQPDFDAVLAAIKALV
ncbi:MAG: thiol peroxidase [Desulfovibrionaceae bacterium]|nr:thiol peroxidase [Desulfovibrionaceae bacterium]